MTLDIPDRLGRPLTLTELAATTGQAEDGLGRVLRYAAGRGFVRQDRRGRYRATGVTRTLRRDAVNSWRGWVEFASSRWFWDAMANAGAALQRDGASGIEAATGHGFFEYIHTVVPAAGASFDAAMQAGATLQALALTRALDWLPVRTVCDVGGGNGAALDVLLSAHAHLRGTLFDLPDVVARALPSLRTGEWSARCRIKAGDFFAGVPSGCDRYLLLAVVHDWDDERAARILRHVATALAPDARAVVVENIVADRPRDDFVTASDILMLVLGPGRERTAAEFAVLFECSGLAVERVITLGSGFTAFVLERAT